MTDPAKLDYASPVPKGPRRLHPVIRVLVGIWAFVFLLPTIDIAMGFGPQDGPIANAIGVVVTLCIAAYLGFVAMTGRFRMRRSRQSDGTTAGS